MEWIHSKPLWTAPKPTSPGPNKKKQKLKYHNNMQDPHLVELGVKYTTVEEVIANSDVLSLNCPLLESTYHMINDDSIATMKRGAMLVNTGRGGLVDSEALIRGLKSGQVGSVRF